MKDVNYHNENLCSIAQIEDSFSGRYIVRDILNRILRNTVLIIAHIERPVFGVSSSTDAISKISSDLVDLTIKKNSFSISFKYYTKENNNDFISTFLEIWFEYEHPAFSFFVSYTNLEIKRMHWEKITSLSPCYVLFKSAEDDVMWVGKSDNLTFENVIV